MAMIRDVVATVASGLVGTLVSTLVLVAWKKRRAARQRAGPPPTASGDEGSASPLSAAQDRDISGSGLYKSTVSAAKSHVQPEDVSVRIFDEKEALKISQAAIGNRLGDYTFLDRSGRTMRLSDYLGKPLVISMIYTHCPIICATTTRSLSAIKMSQDALGADTFGVVTIGFDTENDIPETMNDFAKRMNVDLPNWEFVSSDPDTIKKISKDLGFTYFPSEYGG